ncbi:MAG: hypothetical protein ABL909_02835 [Sphingopyxis sp.]
MRRWLLFVAVVVLSAVVSIAVVYAYPRIAERLETYFLPESRILAVNRRNDCRFAESFTIDDARLSVVRIAGRQTLTQDFAAINQLSTVLSVKAKGLLDVDMRLEAVHRGDGYSEALGFGTYVTYQYSPNLDQIDKAPVIMPEGWASGINIRDLRDHYGLNIFANSMNVEPGYYKFCVFSSAHSYLTSRNDLAELIVDRKFGRRNVLRFSYTRDGRVLR